MLRRMREGHQWFRGSAYQAGVGSNPLVRVARADPLSISRCGRRRTVDTTPSCIYPVFSLFAEIKSLVSVLSLILPVQQRDPGETRATARRRIRSDYLYRNRFVGCLVTNAREEP